jgi:hypothetical protein
MKYFTSTLVLLSVGAFVSADIAPLARTEVVGDVSGDQQAQFDLLETYNEATRRRQLKSKGKGKGGMMGGSKGGSGSKGGYGGDGSRSKGGYGGGSGSKVRRTIGSKMKTVLQHTQLDDLISIFLRVE